MKTVVIIGGGPSGMMAAIAASKEHNVILIEKNEKLGKKLYITGKGRCNVTNAADISDFFQNIPGNHSFLYSSLYSFTNEDTINFFNSRGVQLKTERGGRVFPNSDKSSDIINALKKEIESLNIKVLLNTKVNGFETLNNHIIYANTDKGKIYGEHFIMCTGGLSYPQTGSNGEGLIFVKKLGHDIVKPLPALVPIEISDSYVQELQGLSLKNVELTFKDKSGKTIFSEFGEMLFTHFGISGPIVLSGSRIVNFYKDLKAIINLKPALTSEELDNRIQKDFNENINKSLKNSLDKLLPQKMIPIIIQLSQINEDKKINVITKEERKRLCNILQNFTLNISGLRPIAEAIITAGGVDVKEIDSSTMKSKIVDNLSFAGEMIDVDAFTGGFNLQIAFSTGYSAGINA